MAYRQRKDGRKPLSELLSGSRPDLTNYGYNPQLFQYGAYVGNIVEGKNGTMQNTLAFVEQRNGSMTDRRFAYFQHLNSMIKRISIFTSFEFDLYKLENDQPKNTLDITSIYFSCAIQDCPTNFPSLDRMMHVTISSIMKVIRTL